MKSARLFAAVSFADGERAALAAAAGLLRGRCSAGRFTAPELLHVTLHFFGQTKLDRLGDIEAAMRQAASACEPFAMATGRAGIFGRGDRAVLWLGVDRGAGDLKALQARLSAALAERGFPPEDRPFRAHITVARDVAFGGSPASVDLPEVPLAASAITLMESTTAGGRLEYRPLLAVPLARTDQTAGG